MADPRQGVSPAIIVCGPGRAFGSWYGCLFLCSWLYLGWGHFSPAHRPDNDDVETTSLLKGLIIGFAMAVPVGPIGILCIRKTLAEGQLRGLLIGFGAATADMLYGCVAAFSLTFISNAIASQRLWLRLAGAGILFYLGVRTFRARPVDPGAPVTGGGLLRLYFSALVLSFTNPLTIFAFVAVFAALGLGSGLSVFSEWSLVLGVFLGSSLWFLALTVTASLFRKKLGSVGLRWVSRIAGVLIIISGIIALASLF